MMLLNTFFIGLFAFLFLSEVRAETINARAEIDTNNVLIGDQITLKITSQSAKKYDIRFPMIKDSIGKIEFLSILKTDTVPNNVQLILTKKYIITCFDSGSFVIPPLPVLYSLDRKKYDTSFTNSVSITFKTVDVDTSKAFKDIKPIMEEPVSFWEYIDYILLGLGIIILIVLGIWLYKKYKKKPVEELGYDPSIPPHILAIESLKQLDREKLWQKGEVKLYHTKISDIIRLYIERRFQFLALEMITPEIISNLTEKDVQQELITDIKTVLELSDLVKFAKYQPLPDENGKSMTLSINFVERTTEKDVQNNGGGV